MRTGINIFNEVGDTTGGKTSPESIYKRIVRGYAYTVCIKTVTTRVRKIKT